MTFKDPDIVKNVLEVHQKKPFSIDEKLVRFLLLLVFVLKGDGTLVCSVNGSAPP